MIDCIQHTLRSVRMHGELDDCASAYLDDVLIFSDSLEEHVEHVCRVLSKLRAAGLQVDIGKC